MLSRFDVDKATVANTAVIAEVAIAAPDLSLPEKREQQPLIEYAKSLSKCISEEVKQKIKAMKKDRLLIPV